MQQGKISWAGNKIVDAVLNPLSNKEQQMLVVLRDTMFHHGLQAVCSSAGVVMDSSFFIHHKSWKEY